MKTLAQLFRSRRMEIVPDGDGSAKLRKAESGTTPFYEEINTSDLVFHWKSFALKEACFDTFRRDGDAVARGVEEAYTSARSEHEDGDHMFTLLSAIQAGCAQAKTCKA